jgi:hypothetical protein
MATNSTKSLVWALAGALAGGAAVSLWTATRETASVDAAALEQRLARLEAQVSAAPAAAPASAADAPAADEPAVSVEAPDAGPVADPEDPSVLIDLKPTAPPAADPVPAAYADGRRGPPPDPDAFGGDCATCGATAPADR